MSTNIDELPGPQPEETDYEENEYETNYDEIEEFNDTPMSSLNMEMSTPINMNIKKIFVVIIVKQILIHLIVRIKQ